MLPSFVMSVSHLKDANHTIILPVFTYMLHVTSLTAVVGALIGKGATFDYEELMAMYLWDLP